MADHVPLNAPFDGTEFHNLDHVPAGCSLRDLLRWKLLGSSPARWPTRTTADVVNPRLPERVEPGEMAATFVGHSTFLLQFAGGLNILTDPVWSERVSPVSFAGPRRVRPPAVAFDDLPPIHAVLVSHAHYDHLDLPTLRRLEKRFAPQFITGLGNRKFLRRAAKLARVSELDWWQSCSLRGGDGTWAATFTPAQHWSSRSATSRNRTLWGGFWLASAVTGAPRVFFAADSGLGRHFGLIRAQLGAPDVAFLPIGAYEPRWFMHEQHMNPEDAVQALLALGSPPSVAMHFGTFHLTDEAIDAPAAALATSLQNHGLEPGDFRVPQFGETLRFSAAPSRQL